MASDATVDPSVIDKQPHAWVVVLDWLLEPQKQRTLEDCLKMFEAVCQIGEGVLETGKVIDETRKIVATFKKAASGGFPNRFVSTDEKETENDEFPRINFFEYEEPDPKEKTKIEGVGNIEEEKKWTDVSVIMTWNMWGMAPIDAVKDHFDEIRHDIDNKKEIIQIVTDILKGFGDLLNDHLLAILRDKPIEQRIYQDEQLMLLLGETGIHPDDPNFFAISGYQEAWTFAPEYWFLTTSNGLHDHQARFRRAAYLGGEHGTNLFRGWKWYIGTDNAFREPESIEPPKESWAMTKPFSGRFSAIDPGLLLLSTHEPEAFGYQEFTFQPDRADDRLAMKGCLWGFWMNDAGKGVLAVTTHFLTGNDKRDCVADLEDLLVKKAHHFSTQVDELEVYAFGDFNCEARTDDPTQRGVLDFSSGVLARMSHFTGDSKSTKDGGGSHRLDHIFGGKWNRDAGKFDLLEWDMTSFVVPPRGSDHQREEEARDQHYGSQDPNNDCWNDISTDNPKDYRNGKSDHKMVILVRKN